MVTRTRVFVLSALLVGAVVLAGCSASGAQDPTALNGSWKVESFGATSGVTPADPSVASEMTLDDGKVAGSGGVNSFSGTYDAKDDGSIAFGPLAATEMAGEPAAMEQEAAFFSALAAAKSYEINDGKLVLGDLGNNTLVILAPKE